MSNRSIQKYSSTPTKFSIKKIQAADKFCEALWDFAGRNFGRITVLALALMGIVYVWSVVHK